MVLEKFYYICGMKRLLTIILAIFVISVANAQSEKSIIIDQNSFCAVQSDALTGVNVDPIGVDSSRRPCARIKVKINRMTREEIDQIEVKIVTNNELRKCKTADYDNGLIIEMTAKPSTRFYFNHPDFGESNEVTLNLDPSKEYYMEASLNQTYSIVINTNVDGADIYLDGVMRGRTDASCSLTVREVLVGQHTLKVVYGGIEHEQKIEVNGSNISFRQVVDVAGAKPQYVVFSVEPKNAVVVIDNQQYVPEDGAVLTVLANGTYSYTVTARGYHTQSGTFTVAGTKVERTVKLKSDAATVTLTAADGADIYVNGKRVGSGKWTGELISGTYIFEARKSGCNTTSISQTITSTTAVQSYELTACTPIYGGVEIVSTPLMADITIDGKGVGRTPLQLDNLLVGEHTIKISKQGYKEFVQKITISEGKTEKISATLTKVEAPAATQPTTTATAAKPTVKDFGNIEMVFVEGGTFSMGSRASDAYGVETPAHDVTLSSFYIGKYEVTQGQWRAVMGSNPKKYTGDNMPVKQISWDDAQAFIKKLNALTGKNYRLPTEAEWEYAGCGGNKSKGYRYSGSNVLKDVAWYGANTIECQNVGKKQPNELGIYDMSGNVWEWCQDWYSNYSSSPQTNPKGPSAGKVRVLRGGSYYRGSEHDCRLAARISSPPYFSSYEYGFRLACDVE